MSSEKPFQYEKSDTDFFFFFYPFNFKRFFSLESDTTQIENSKKKLFATLDTYDKILSKQKYIAGDVHIVPLSSN